MRKVCAKIVPKNLTIEQKENWRNAFVDREMIATDHECFNHVIMGDVSWCFEYNPEIKRERATTNQTSKHCWFWGMMD